MGFLLLADMKRIDQSILSFYSPLILFLDDLTEILQIFKDADKSPEISTKEYLYDSIEEMQEKNKSGRLTCLNIRTHTPYISLDLTPYHAYLQSLSSRVEAAGLFLNIDKVLRRRQRSASWLFSFGGRCFLAILLGVMVPILFRKGIIVGLISILVCGGSIVWTSWIKAKCHSLIILRPKSGFSGFVQRNKDQLIVGIVTTILGAILGVIVTLVCLRIGK